MCGSFELKTKFVNLQILKRDYPIGLDIKYQTQNLIRPITQFLLIRTREELKLLLCHGALFHLGPKTHLIKKT